MSISKLSLSKPTWTGAEIVIMSISKQTRATKTTNKVFAPGVDPTWMLHALVDIWHKRQGFNVIYTKDLYHLIFLI